MVAIRSLLCLLGGLASLGSTVAPSLHHKHKDWDLSKPMNGVSFQRAKAITHPTPDRSTMRFSRLKSLKGQFGKHSVVSALGRAARKTPSTEKHPFQNVTAVGEFSTQYAIQCGWDGVPVWLLFDTGSSDSWAAEARFECDDGTGRTDNQAACGFGRPHIAGFSQGRLDEVHFSIEYGSGEQVSGPMGYSDISCGGVSVAKQQVGLANHTYWHGNNVTVGILGLAYPSITSAYYGSIGDEAPWNSMTYTPYLTNAIAQGSMDPVFSVALMKNSSSGVIAWGGLPPMEWGSRHYAATELIIANLINQDESAYKYSFYTIVVDGVKWGLTTDTTKYPYIIDTGTTMMYLPPPLAEAIAMSFQPRAVYLYQWGAYFAPCDSVPPLFAIIISGVEFWINPADMIYKDLIDPMTGYCAIAVSTGGSGPYILGDAFLQNVVAVFDVGGAQMRFYSKK